jgi:hypothetical protein
MIKTCFFQELYSCLNCKYGGKTKKRQGDNLCDKLRYRIGSIKKVNKLRSIHQHLMHRRHAPNYAIWVANYDRYSAKDEQTRCSRFKLLTRPCTTLILFIFWSVDQLAFNRRTVNVIIQKYIVNSMKHPRCFCIKFGNA